MERAETATAIMNSEPEHATGIPPSSDVCSAQISAIAQELPPEISSLFLLATGPQLGASLKPATAKCICTTCQSSESGALSGQGEQHFPIEGKSGPFKSSVVLSANPDASVPVSPAFSQYVAIAFLGALYMEIGGSRMVSHQCPTGVPQWRIKGPALAASFCCKNTLN